MSGPVSFQQTISHDIGENGVWLTGMSGAIRQINNLSYKYGTNKQQLYDRLGQRILQWIHYNFDVEGAEKPWKRLSPGTVFINQALGRGGPKILQGTGKLRRSFTVKTGPNFVSVGSPLIEAVYAQAGTRLHWISARAKERLAFPWQGQKNPTSGHVASAARVKQVWKKGKTAAKALPMQKAGKSKKAFSGTSFGFFTEVRHSRMEPRRILPSPRMTKILIEQVLTRYRIEQVSGEVIGYSGFGEIELPKPQTFAIPRQYYTPLQRARMGSGGWELPKD